MDATNKTAVPPFLCVEMNLPSLEHAGRNTASYMAMAAFDDVREHLESSLGNSSAAEVVSYLDRWVRSGSPLRLMLGYGYVNYPSLSDLPGRNEESRLPVPWRFSSPEAATRFCRLVEEAFQAAGSTCTIER